MISTRSIGKEQTLREVKLQTVIGVGIVSNVRVKTEWVRTVCKREATLNASASKGEDERESKKGVKALTVEGVRGQQRAKTSSDKEQG